MNLPNKLTVLRLFITAVFVLSLTVSFPLAFTIALILFIAASITDYLDGAIARKHGLITDFGKLMDPLADKILTAAAFICLIPFGALPAWVVITIISREFLITGLRLLAGSEGVVLPAERLGKHKTGWQIATVIYFLLMLALGRDWGFGDAAWYSFAWSVVGGAMVAITTALTVYSGTAYFWKNRSLIRNA